MSNKDLLVRVHVPDALGGGFITLKPTEGSSFEAFKVKSLEKLVAKGIKAADPKSAADFCLCILWNGEIKVLEEALLFKNANLQQNSSAASITLTLMRRSNVVTKTSKTSFYSPKKSKKTKQSVSRSPLKSPEPVECTECLLLIKKGDRTQCQGCEQIFCKDHCSFACYLPAKTAGKEVKVCQDCKEGKNGQSTGKVIPFQEHTKNCHRCTKKFTTTKRRHHCRHCGHACCAQCTAHKLAIPEIGCKDKVRICWVCMNDLVTLRKESGKDAGGDEMSKIHQLYLDTMARELDEAAKAKAKIENEKNNLLLGKTQAEKEAKRKLTETNQKALRQQEQSKALLRESEQEAQRALRLKRQASLANKSMEQQLQELRVQLDKSIEAQNNMVTDRMQQDRELASLRSALKAARDEAATLPTAGDTTTALVAAKVNSGAPKDLTIGILQGTGLAAVNRDGSSNPFVRAFLRGGESRDLLRSTDTPKLESKVQRSTLNPVFEHFATVPFGAGIWDRLEVFVFEAWSWVEGSEEVCLGVVRLTAKQIIEAYAKMPHRPTQTFKLHLSSSEPEPPSKSLGYLVVSVAFSYFASIARAVHQEDTLTRIKKEQAEQKALEEREHLQQKMAVLEEEAAAAAAGHAKRMLEVAAREEQQVIVHEDEMTMLKALIKSRDGMIDGLNETIETLRAAQVQKEREGEQASTDRDDTFNSQLDSMSSENSKMKAKLGDQIEMLSTKLERLETENKLLKLRFRVACRNSHRLADLLEEAETKLYA